MIQFSRLNLPHRWYYVCAKWCRAYIHAEYTWHVDTKVSYRCSSTSQEQADKSVPTAVSLHMWLDNCWGTRHWVEVLVNFSLCYIARDEAVHKKSYAINKAFLSEAIAGTATSVYKICHTDSKLCSNGMWDLQRNRSKQLLFKVLMILA